MILLKDVIHLYLGCECLLRGQIEKLTGISFDDQVGKTWCYFENTDASYSLLESVKPILRPLSDMTEEEANEVWKLFGWNERITNYQERMMNILWEFNPPEEDIEPEWEPGRWKYLISALPYLLKQGFDLFNLIETNQAIKK